MISFSPVQSFTPTTGLDATEVTVGTPGSTLWYFNYGHSNSYGAYLRDVRWSSPTIGSVDRYFGLISVPWVKINNDQYNLPQGTSTKGHVMTIVGGTAYMVWSTHVWKTGLEPTTVTHTVNVTFILYDAPPSGNSTDAFVVVEVSYSNSDLLHAIDWDFKTVIRVDIDIYGLSTPGNDLAYAYSNPGPTWHQQTTEVTCSAVNPLSPSPYLMKVKMDDGGSVWAGITRDSSNDAYHIVKYNSGEFTGNPINYVSNENINGQDIVIWYEQVYTKNPPCSVTITNWMT